MGLLQCLIQTGFWKNINKLSQMLKRQTLVPLSTTCPCDRIVTPAHFVKSYFEQRARFSTVSCLFCYYYMVYSVSLTVVLRSRLNYFKKISVCGGRSLGRVTFVLNSVNNVIWRLHTELLINNLAKTVLHESKLRNRILKMAMNTVQ